MTKISSLLLSCVVLLGASSVQANDAHINPLYAASTLQFEYPAFDKIRNEDFAPAFRDGMLLHAEEITRIANNFAPPSFDNTVVAMERAGQLLGRTSRTFFNLKGTLTNPVSEDLERHHTYFVRVGARLSFANQKKLKVLNQRLATLETTFSQNV